LKKPRAAQGMGGNVPNNKPMTHHGRHRLLSGIDQAGNQSIARFLFI